MHKRNLRKFLRGLSHNFPFNVWILLATVLIGIFLKKKHTKPYYLSVCAMFKNEGRYLREWIEFHKLAGVDHFYLYNNFSGDNYQGILAEYIAKGEVTLTEWPVKSGQYEAYKHCIDNFKDSTKWILFLDLDEFAVPKTTGSLKDIVSKYELFPSFAAHWKMFGSSGHIEDDKEALVTERFTVSASKLDQFVKTFANMDWAKYLVIYQAHIVYAKVPFFGKKLYPVMENLDSCLHLNNTNYKRNKKMQINHYAIKSYQEFVTKKIPDGLSDREGARKIDDFYRVDMMCDSVDHSIFRFMSKLKNILSGNQI